MSLFTRICPKCGDIARLKHWGITLNGYQTSMRYIYIRLRCENYDLKQEVKSLKRMVNRLVRWEKQHEQAMEV